VIKNMSQPKDEYRKSDISMLCDIILQFSYKPNATKNGGADGTPSFADQAHSISRPLFLPAA
jgi:hypothetical protein